jgi:WD40 repeat protein
LEAHTDEIHSIDTIIFGEMVYIASGSKDKSVSIIIFDYKNWSIQKVAQLNGHKDCVGAVAFIQLSVFENIYLLTGSHDKIIKLWDSFNYQLVKDIKGHTGKIYAIKVRQSDNKYDKTICVSGGGDNKIIIWDVNDWNIVKVLLGHVDWIRSVAIWVETTDNIYIVSGSIDKTVRIWDYHSGKSFRVLSGHTDRINAVAVYFINGRVTIISGSHDTKTCLWDLYSGEKILEFESLAKETNGKIWCVTAFEISLNNWFIIDGNSDKVITVWNLAYDGDSSLLCSNKTSSFIRKVKTFILDSQSFRLAYIEEEGTKIYLETINQLVFEDRDIVVITSPTKVLNIEFCGKKEYLTIVGGCNNGLIYVWNMEGKKLFSIESHIDTVNSLSSIEYSSTEFFLLSGSSDKTVLCNFVDAKSGYYRSKLTINHHKCKVTAVQGHTSLKYGQIILSGSEAPEKSVIVSDFNGNLITSFSGKKGHLNNIISIKCIDTLREMENDTIVITGGDRTVRLWSLGAKCLLFIFHEFTGTIFQIETMIIKDQFKIMISTEDGNLFIHELSGVLIRSIRIPFRKNLNCLSIQKLNQDSEYFVVYPSENGIMVMLTFF